MFGKKCQPVKTCTVSIRLADEVRTFTNVVKVYRHCHELEIVDIEGNHTFFQSYHYTTYWHTDWREITS